MMRGEEAARELAEALGSDEAVQDAQPLSLEDLAAVNGHAAAKAANEAIKAERAPDGEPKTLHYNNFGAEFDYSISGKALKESLNPKQQEKSDSRGIHLAVAEHIDDVINESIEVEEHPDYIKDEKGNRKVGAYNKGVLMHRLYGAITIDGRTYRVKTTVKEIKENTEGKAYAYEVTSIELLEEHKELAISNSAKSNNSNGSKRAKGYVHVAKLLQNVEKSYDLGKKLLDESKLADEDAALYRDPDETEDIWKDQSMGLQERITAAATRLANNHRDNKTLRDDAMRAIGGNLSDLRKAMSLQRRFDRDTVKRVANLARALMSGGYLNGLSQKEVKRLLAAVKNSAGRDNIEGDVQKVMDIMVDNQLKHAENTLHELEAIRGSKVDARGVEVQGQLDPSGVHIMTAFKKARDLEKDAINDAISEVQQRMSSNDAGAWQRSRLRSSARASAPCGGKSRSPSAGCLTSSSAH